MIVTCQFKRLDFSPSLAKYIEERLERLETFCKGHSRAHVTVSKSGHSCSIYINLKLPNSGFRAQCQSKDFYIAVDKACFKLAGQIKKRRAKLRSHRNYEVADTIQHESDENRRIA